jgi:cold shock CspA family protein
MGNRVTTNKKDREKSKQQKRLEKQKRKEQRQSNGPSSFDDMIAYVDEYGRLSDTPPEESAEEVNVEDILIATPKKSEEEEVDERVEGKVDFFNPSKGFGFIRNNDGSEKYFFHISNAPEEIREGDKVSFEITQDAKGQNAVDIVIINNNK